MNKKVYLIGSLKNWKVVDVGNRLRREFSNWEIFEDWIGCGPKADDYCRKFEKKRGSSYKQALTNYLAKYIFDFDKHHLDASDIVILITPCGRSGHLELGYGIGKGKEGYVLFDEELKRWDVMYQFCNEVFFNVEELINTLKDKRDLNE
jgi:hypothetical protein